MSIQNALDVALFLRIKLNHWDKMLVHYSKLTEISNAPMCKISNIPVRKESNEEKRLLFVIKRLRLNEICEIRRKGNKASTQVTSWPVFLDESWATSLFSGLFPNQGADGTELSDLIFLKIKSTRTKST